MLHYGKVPFWSCGSVHSSTMVVVGVVLFVWRKEEALVGCCVMMRDDSKRDSYFELTYVHIP